MSERKNAYRTKQCERLEHSKRHPSHTRCTPRLEKLLAESKVQELQRALRIEITTSKYSSDVYNDNREDMPEISTNNNLSPITCTEVVCTEMIVVAGEAGLTEQIYQI